MIKAPSIQAVQSLIYSGDPALKLPEDDAEKARLINLARETGDWSGLIGEGQTPTTFDIKPMTGTAREWLYRWIANEKPTELEIAALALRLSLRKVTNLGDFKVKQEADREFWITTPDIIDAIYAAVGDDPDKHGEGRIIVLELGALAFQKAQERPSPKS